MTTEPTKLTLDALEKELRDQWRRIYTSEEMAQFWGGPKYPGSFVFFNRDATRDTIVHFADGIGDINLLYRDEEYARKTKHGRLIAPPAFIFSICSLASAPAVRDQVHGWDSGYEVEWFRPIGQGDSLDWKVCFPSDLQRKKSKMAGESLVIYTEAEFANQNRNAVAISKEWAIHVETDKAIETNKYAEIKPYTYTEEELSAIYFAQDNEEVRGDEPRYWEDVQIGDTLPEVVRGPLTMMEVAAWLVGCGSPISKPDNIWRRIDLYDRVLRDPVIGCRLNTELIHMDDRVGRMVGLPAAYDFGVQRISLLSSLLTNWMGNDGFLWKLRGELRKFNLTGDTQWFKGKVVRKHSDNGIFSIEIDCWAENQRREITTPGSATVILPSREHGPAVYPPERHVG
jgi:acyl dehydratase